MSPTISFPGTDRYTLTLTAFDGELTTSDSATVWVQGPGSPVMDAGPDQAIALNAAPTPLTLTGGGNADSYSWLQLSGPTSATIAQNGRNCTVSFYEMGTYVFRFFGYWIDFVNPFRYCCGWDDVTITVTWQSPPVVNAGPDQWTSTHSATLAGVVSDDGLPNPPGAVTYTWAQVSGPGAAIVADANAATTVVTFPVSGTYVFRLTASDSVLSGHDEVSIFVVPVLGGVPYGGTPWAIPGTVQAENYDVGGEGVAYHDTTPGQPYGVYFYRTDDVDMTNGSGLGNGYEVTTIDSGEWLSYTCNIAKAGSYVFSVNARSWNPAATMHLQCDGNDITAPIPLTNTGAYAHATNTVPACVLPAGRHVLRLCFHTDSFAVDWFSAALVNASPKVTMPADVMASLPGAASPGAVALNATVSDDGLPASSTAAYTWSLISGPTNGAVTFTNPNAAGTMASFNRVGTYTLQLDANDSALHAVGTVTVTVQADLRADFDHNGVVDGLDFLAWQRNYNHGTAASGAPIVDANFNDPNYAKANGDANGDGKTDGQDFLIWQQGYMFGH